MSFRFKILLYRERRFSTSMELDKKQVINHTSVRRTLHEHCWIFYVFLCIDYAIDKVQ